MTIGEPQLTAAATVSVFRCHGLGEQGEYLCETDSRQKPYLPAPVKSFVPKCEWVPGEFCRLRLYQRMALREFVP